MVILGAGAFLGISRSVAIVKYYNSLMKTVEESNPLKAGLLCYGDSWYRFPSHFFIENKDARIGFIQTGFDGLLPKYFSETQQGTRVRPVGMNGQNRADRNQYVSNVDQCSYFVGTLQEADKINVGKRVVKCNQLLAPERSPSPFRWIWIPFISVHKIQHDQYCLFELFKLS